MDIQSLQTHARHVRQDIIKMTAKAGAGHPGGSLSCTDVLVALYFDVMKNVDPADDKNPLRDRFVLSKGHAAPALYGTLCERGYFDEKEFDLFRQLLIFRRKLRHRVRGLVFIIACVSFSVF